ncbi:MAG TPA: MBL fold metallo-hydrolase [Desulfosalsimonadaceae bacterium]|nr:MBL fold metallo-hydrolase [Desulfosalsimonadaceae bacterium]
MKIAKHKSFGPVQAWELGWSPVGRPLMTVHIYIVGGVMIDTGLRHMRKEVLRIAREHEVEAVLLTHYHEDHAANAAALSRHCHIPVYAQPRTCRKMQKPGRIFPYQHLIWGASDPLEAFFLPDCFIKDGFRLQPLSAPGHSKDHTVFWEPHQGWLFSGDLYLSDRIKYFRADENIACQIRSLRKILRYDFDSLFCAHHPVATNGRRRLRAKLRYLEDFYGRVSELADMGFDAKTIMKRLQLKESRFIQCLCFGNVSMKNMVQSVIDTRADNPDLLRASAVQGEERSFF